MATVEHKDITDANLHEPKGVAAAAAGKVYVSDGAGSGTWDFAKPPGTLAAPAGQVYVSDGAGGGSYQTLTPESTYGEMYIQSNAVATTISTVSTLTKITAGLAAGPLDGVTFSTDHLVIVESGKYILEATLTFFGVAATALEWEFDFMINAGALGRKVAMSTTGAERTVVTLQAITGTLAVSDQIALGVYNTTDANDPTIVHASLVARKL